MMFPAARACSISLRKRLLTMKDRIIIADETINKTKRVARKVNLLRLKCELRFLDRALGGVGSDRGAIMNG